MCKKYLLMSFIMSAQFANATPLATPLLSPSDPSDDYAPTLEYRCKSNNTCSVVATTKLKNKEILIMEGIDPGDMDRISVDWVVPERIASVRFALRSSPVTTANAYFNGSNSLVSNYQDTISTVASEQDPDGQYVAIGDRVDGFPAINIFDMFPCNKQVKPRATYLFRDASDAFAGLGGVFEDVRLYIKPINQRGFEEPVEQLRMKVTYQSGKNYKSKTVDIALKVSPAEYCERPLQETNSDYAPEPIVDNSQSKKSSEKPSLIEKATSAIFSGILNGIVR